MDSVKIRELAVELRRRAERFYGSDLDKAQSYARWIINIARRTGDETALGFGLMTLGDVQHYRTLFADAWDTLEEASQHFLNGDYPVGWARTWLGRLNIGLQIPARIAEIEAALPTVIQRLQADEEPDLMVRLGLNLGSFRFKQGRYQEAMHWTQYGYQFAVLVDHPLLPNVANTVGTVSSALGQMGKARQFYEQARVGFQRNGQKQFASMASKNIAATELVWGRYEAAIRYYQESIPTLNKLEAADANAHIALCWYRLGNYQEALKVVNAALDVLKLDTYQSGFALLVKAETCIEIGRFDEAQQAFDQAIVIFKAVGAEAWLASTYTRYVRLALARKDAKQAIQLLDALPSGTLVGHYVRYAADLMYGSAALLQNDTATAITKGWHSLELVRHERISDARHDAHLLLGQAYAADGRIHRAIQHFQAAAAVLERIQSALGRHTRRSFINRHTRTHSTLIRLLLQADRPVAAFDVLERLKAQLFQRYFRPALELVRHEQLHAQDGETTALYEARQQKRHQLTELAIGDDPLIAARGTQSAQSNGNAAGTGQTTTSERVNLQREIARLTQQIDLLEASSVPFAGIAASVSYEVVREHLDEETHLIEFFDDGESWWVFSISRESLQCRRLDVPRDTLQMTVDSLWQSITGAIAAGAERSHAGRIQRTNATASRLGDQLIRPVLDLIGSSVKRLIVVPFGLLHYVPFGLIQIDGAYLVNRYELVVNPSASLLTRPHRTHARRAIVMAYAEGDNLPEVNAEAEQVSLLLDGECYSNERATRQWLTSGGVQVLHIAAHARHDMVSPNESFIQLADGRLYADDVIRFAPACELVTLSGCETGRSLPGGGDDVIGIGVEFLRTGAGALISSLWQADDALTAQFMIRFYRHLSEGMTKSGALQQTQRYFIDTHPDLHPAFWSTFQLSGNTSPISGLIRSLPYRPSTA